MSWKYFSQSEFDCRCGCGLTASPILIGKLELARGHSGVPYIITSGARCEAHNAAVGASPTSSHIGRWAADIKAESAHERFRVLEGLFMAGVKRIGIAKNFVHADIDPDKSAEVVWLYD